MMAKWSQKSERSASGSGSNTSMIASKVPTLVFTARSRALAEESGGLQQEDGDEDEEYADLAEVLAKEQTAQGFGDADDEAAEQRAGKAPHPAQHDNGEGDQHEAFADAWMRVVARQQQTGSGADAGDTDAEAHRVDMLDVDADETRPLALACHRADRLAEIGAANKQPQRESEEDGRAKGDHLRDRDGRDAEIDGREGVGGIDGA